jgi:hypothetical protein
MEFFTFDLTEFQVLEDIEFDETIQRPERIRFYTVQEQTTDAYERMLPRGRVTRFQREEVQREIDRLNELYSEFVVATAEDYKLREPVRGTNLPWVHPIYVSNDRKAYDWGSLYKPLFDNPRQPNFYPRLISALPRPYTEATEGVPYPLTQPTQLTAEDGFLPVRALPVYELTRTQRHEDKTVSIVKVPVEGTQDVIAFKGYALDKRGIDIPNPLADHLFLKSTDATVVETTSPLTEVAPSVDAVMTHGVPVTNDPYRVADPYLRLYDIRLQDIPWSSWKARFPPVEVISTRPEVLPLEFPKPSQLAPPENVLEKYKSSYSPGISVRNWLMHQLDGGDLIPKMLLSKVIDNGSVELIPGVDLPTASYPTTTMEECRLTSTSFPEFQTRGILRRTWGDTITLQCVPLEFVKQERARMGYTNRKAWKETTGAEILEEYSRAIETVRPVGDVLPKATPETKTPARPESIRRTEVLAVQTDSRRLPEDKLRDIQELLKETTLKQNVYSDPEGLFVFCAHTLAVIAGDLATDRRTFYDKWTSKDEGFRVCKFCGEQVTTEDLVDQDDFDDNERAIKHASALEETAFDSEVLKGFLTGLRALEPMFVLDNAHDSTVFLLLSVLQVLPTADALEPLLKAGRTRAAIQFQKGSADQVAKFTGMMGIATTVLLLQTHVPMLIPRRSFGSRPLKLDGYPRDAPKPDEYSIVDALLMVIRKTFESYPAGSFRGPSQAIVRAVLSKPAEIKNAVTLMVSEKSPLMADIKSRDLFARAIAYRSGMPRVEQPVTLIPVMPMPKEFGVIRTYPACPSNRPIWLNAREPRILQKTVPLRAPLYASKLARFLRPAVSVRMTPVPVPKTQLQALAKKKTGLKVRLLLKDDYHTNLAVASRLADAFLLPLPVRTVDPRQNAAELRDLAQGMVYELLSQIQKDPSKVERFEQMKDRDIALYALLSDPTEQKAGVNRLRAQERLTFVDRMAQKTDQEREVIGDLLRVGLAPYIISNRDRALFAQEAEALGRQLRVEDEAFDVDRALQETEDGVGRPRDFFDQGESNAAAGVDFGDYGDYAAEPRNDGRDPEGYTLNDDPESSI